MPVVSYYLGRPAHVWIAATSRRRIARATAANSSARTAPARGISLARARPVPAALERRTLEAANAASITAASSRT